jgi:hypothetical protein
MLVDLLSKTPMKIFFGLMISVRGALTIWTNIGEVYLTNDVKFRSIHNI